MSEKPQPNVSPEKQERQKWLTLNVLMPLEDNYRTTFTARQIDTWVEFFAGGRWTRPEILQTLRFILRDLRFAPTMADWDKLRPKRSEDMPGWLKEEIGDSFARFEANAPEGSWPQFVARETKIGLKARDMLKAYERIHAEGVRRGIQADELASYQRAIERCREFAARREAESC